MAATRAATLARALWAPERRCVALLLLALCIVFASVAGRSYQLDSMHTTWSLEYLTDSENRSPAHGFVGFHYQYLNSEGEHAYHVYNRFPIGGYLAIKAVMLPFQGDAPAQRQAARALMLAFFAAAMLAAYFALKRLTANPSVALAATLLGFSSYYALGLADMIATEGVMDLFAVLLVFHALVVFVQEGRFGQVLGKTCVALLIGWHVFALLLPFIVLGLAAEWLRGKGSVFLRAWRLLRSRHVALGAVALTVGVLMLALNFGLEGATSTGDEPLRAVWRAEEASRPYCPGKRHPTSYQSLLRRTGLDSGFDTRKSINLRTTLERAFDFAGRASLPYGAEAVLRQLLDMGGATEAHRKSRHCVETAVQAPPATDRADHREEARSLASTGALVWGLLAFLGAVTGIATTRFRTLWGTLTLLGFCWAFLAPGNPSGNEGLFFVGLPLALWAVALTHAQSLPVAAGATNCCVAVALLVFSLSALQVSDWGWEKAPTTVDIVSELASDKEATHDVAPERSVIVALVDSHAVPYLLTGRILLSPFSPFIDEHRHRADFLLSDCIVGDEGLLTPGNRHYFLYERATYDARYAALDDARLRRSCPHKQHRPLLQTESSLDATPLLSGDR